MPKPRYSSTTRTDIKTAASWLTGVVANAPSRGTRTAGAMVRYPMTLPLSLACTPQ